MTALHNGVWGDQDDADTFATVKAALDAGVNFFDNAEMYGDGCVAQLLSSDAYTRYWLTGSSPFATV
jgi:aryl-alcohol dehydrogenase-like predicted oxidoreductase